MEQTDQSKVDPREFRRVLGRFASGVTVITTVHEGSIHGMTANAFVSVSLDPPLVLVSVGNWSNMNKILPHSKRYGVSSLSDKQTDLSKHFGGRRKEGIEIPLELARIGSLLFIFADSPNDQIGSSSTIDTFATRLSAQPLSGNLVLQCHFQLSYGCSASSSERERLYYPLPESFLTPFVVSPVDHLPRPELLFRQLPLRANASEPTASLLAASEGGLRRITVLGRCFY